MNAELKEKDPNFDLFDWIKVYNQEKNLNNKLTLKVHEDFGRKYLDVWAPEELIVRFSELNILDSKSLGVILLDALKKIIDYHAFSNKSQFTTDDMDVIYEDLMKITPQLGLQNEVYYNEKLKDLRRSI